MVDHRVPWVDFQSNSTKRMIVSSYWVVILLTVPLWWYTTSIERLELPKIRLPEQQNVFTTHIAISWPEESHRIEKLIQKLKHNKLCETGTSLLFEPHHSATYNSSEPNFYTVEITNNEIPTGIRKSALVIGVRGRNEGVLATEISFKLCELLSPLFSPSDEHRTIQYSSTYRLAFSLLNEDAASGAPIMGWYVKSAFESSLAPIVEQLKPLHNFSIESQIQLQASLAFDLSQKDGNAIVDRENLSVFVNSEEWSLVSGVSQDPVLHFVLFVPSLQHRPLFIEGLEGVREQPHSFIIPRWGGIVIYNPPETSPEDSPILSSAASDQIFLIFRNQLLQLLGVPEDKQVTGITDWQLYALLRRRMRENVANSQDTLTSIMRLVQSLPNLPFSKSVQDNVKTSLDALQQVYCEIHEHPTRALQESAQALKFASEAFFHPDMLAMLYFPPEHTYAVYLPLFAPALMPLLVTLLKELRSWRNERKEKAKME